MGRKLLGPNLCQKGLKGLPTICIDYATTTKYGSGLLITYSYPTWYVMLPKRLRAGTWRRIPEGSSVSLKEMCIWRHREVNTPFFRSWRGVVLLVAEAPQS